MAGNVWQWIGDVYEEAHYRTMRGGSKAGVRSISGGKELASGT
jgi:formylglycine-generating enzyme required for sulfatase activity